MTSAHCVQPSEKPLAARDSSNLAYLHINWTSLSQSDGYETQGFVYMVTDVVM